MWQQWVWGRSAFGAKDWWLKCFCKKEEKAAPEIVSRARAQGRCCGEGVKVLYYLPAQWWASNKAAPCVWVTDATCFQAFSSFPFPYMSLAWALTLQKARLRFQHSSFVAVPDGSPLWKSIGSPVLLLSAKKGSMRAIETRHSNWRCLAAYIYIRYKI